MTIKERREQLGMQQKELLALLREDDPRIDIGTLSRMEHGFVLPTSEELLASLEKHLQADRSELFNNLEVFAIENTKSHREANTDVVAGALKYGKQNAIKREELCEILGVSDRQMRKMIEDAKRDGLVVCSDQDGNGYFLADTKDEYRRQYWQTYNRAMSLLVQLKYSRQGML